MYKNKVKKITLLATIFIFLAFVSCQSQGGVGKEEPPDWVLNPPAGDDNYEYFIGYASDESGNRANAEDLATSTLISEIVRFMGVEISADSTAEVKAGLDELETSIKQTVKQSSDARMSGFKVIDRYWYKDENGITIYILARYEKRELIKEKERLEALFKERYDAIAVPEGKGDSFIDSGRYFEAAAAYLDAARAAADSSLKNKEIRFNRNLDKAINALIGLEIEKTSDNLTAMVGKPFPSQFEGRVINKIGSSLEGVPNVQLTISYRATSPSGKTRIITDSVITDDNGYFSFSIENPGKPGKGEVIVRLDLSSKTELFDNLPSSYSTQVDELNQLLLSKETRFYYFIDSVSRKIPTAVVISEMDAAGNLLGLQHTATGFTSSLSDQGYTLERLPDMASLLVTSGEDAVIKQIKKIGKVKRIILGTSQLDEFSKDGNNVIVKVIGRIKVYDLETGRILASVEGFKRARGSSVDSALSAAFGSLGESLAEEVLKKLP
ncbi:hypothetical protein WKV44_03050 [Spirochaetia bacterium 38H-sp]|uniref:Curli production assembly/transport component CsgG n=1 Tax=Rarispira pelagica TaxID=3141764 RepID=A0ABU9UA37_9SPIR